MPENRYRKNGMYGTLVPNSQIYEVPEFVSSSTCGEIVAWLKGNKEYEPENDGNSAFNGRTIPFKKIDDATIKQIVGAFRFDITFKVRQLFEEALYPDYTDLVYWPDGMDMDVHADAAWPDGSPNYCAYRHVSAVVYLNDDYEGGETYFPDFEYEVKPETGKAVFFLSDLQHRHGVREVKGERYTMPIWFTKDLTYLEMDE